MYIAIHGYCEGNLNNADMPYLNYIRIIHYRYLLLAAIVVFLFFSFCEKQDTSATVILEPAPGSPIAMSCSPGNIKGGDLNEDGIPDLVAACSESKTITIFFGRGEGQFNVAGNPILLPFAPHEIEIRDMNRDDHADLVIASHDSYDVMILPGNGTGSFIISTALNVTMKTGNHPHTHGLATGDMNSDGYPDVVTANSSDNDIAVMLHEGNNGFVSCPGSPFPVSTSPYPLALGDLNSDGHQDIVSTSTNSKFLSVLFGDGQGHFTRSDLALRTTGPGYAAIGDINNDAVRDLVITHLEHNKLTVLRGNGGGNFTELANSPFNLGSRAWHVAIANFNHDAHPDVIAAAGNGVRVMFGNDGEQFVPAPGSPFATGVGSWRLDIGDWNGDNRTDVVTSNLESNNVSVLLGR